MIQSNKYITLVLYENNHKISIQMIMSSNIPLIPTSEHMIKDVIGNFKIYQQEASQIENENPIRNYSDKDMACNN